MVCITQLSIEYQMGVKMATHLHTVRQGRYMCTVLMVMDEMKVAVDTLYIAVRTHILYSTIPDAGQEHVAPRLISRQIEKYSQ
jgi:hypothetical protein